ncbi:MAG TPA: hypothetical protein VE978_16815 [Chitinophagales bacterium]|nr:hypothetical protein [Chitinophagales bacterium]
MKRTTINSTGRTELIYRQNNFENSKELDDNKQPNEGVFKLLDGLIRKHY